MTFLTARINEDGALEYEKDGVIMTATNPTKFAATFGDKSKKGWNTVLTQDGIPLLELREQLVLDSIDGNRQSKSSRKGKTNNRKSSTKTKKRKRSEDQKWNEKKADGGDEGRLKKEVEVTPPKRVRPPREPKPCSEYAKKLKRLFYKNSILSRLDLSDVLSYDVYNSLTPEEKQHLAQHLPLCDIDLETGFASERMFKYNNSFLESIYTLQQLIANGTLNPNKNTIDVFEDLAAGNVEEGFNEFWLSNAQNMDMSWIDDL